MMKLLKVLVGFALVLGIAYFGYSLMTKKSVDSMDVMSADFDYEVSRFSQFEPIAVHDKKVNDLIGKGKNIRYTFSALTPEKIASLRTINDELEKYFLAEENDPAVRFQFLSNKFEKLVVELREQTRTIESQGQFDVLVREGRGIIMNRMAVNDVKVRQLEDVIIKLEKGFA